MAKLNNLERFMRDAKLAIEKHPEDIQTVLIIVYAHGIGNAMRAVGRWPPNKPKRKRRE